MDPEECLILEDNENGIAAAEASGAHVMRIDNVEDVTYDDIKRAVESAEGATQ